MNLIFFSTLSSMCFFPIFPMDSKHFPNLFPGFKNRSTTWFHEEQVDGEATVKWMRRQAWCNGKVGVTGDSVGTSVGRRWQVLGVLGPSNRKIAGLVMKPRTFYSILCIHAIWGLGYAKIEKNPPTRTTNDFR